MLALLPTWVSAYDMSAIYVLLDRSRHHCWRAGRGRP